MDSIPNVPSWDFVFGFIVGEIVIIVLWIVIEWIARGK
jgi:hypothetical protein